MEKQTDKADGAIRKFQFYTKKIEGIMTVITFILFFLSLNSSIFSISSIAFFVVVIIALIYYIFWYRKKPSYIAVGGDSIIVSRGLFFKFEEIENNNIKGVNVTDGRIKINYLKEGTQTSVSLFSILLEKKDKDEIIKCLKALAPGE